MKNILLTAVTCFILTLAAHAQRADCPPQYICLTDAEMKFYLGRDDKAKALEAEMKVKDKALDDEKAIVTDLKVELAKATGTLTGAQQSIVDLRSTVQVLSANCKARNRIGLFVF